MKNKIIILLLALTLPVGYAGENVVALKTNLVYTATTFTPNLAAEVKLNKKISLQANGSYNPWNLNGSVENNSKLVHWAATVEARYYLKEVFDGHHFSIEGIASNYNISERSLSLFFGQDAEKYRFEGAAFGVGINYGYSWILGKNIAIEAQVGFGYINFNYDRYGCTFCSNVMSNETKNYFGPTKLAVSFIVNFKL